MFMKFISPNIVYFVLCLPFLQNRPQSGEPSGQKGKKSYSFLFLREFWCLHWARREREREREREKANNSCYEEEEKEEEEEEEGESRRRRRRAHTDGKNYE